MFTEHTPAPMDFGGIVRRLAVPFLLFALVLTTLLLLSWVLLLPHFTSISVKGSVMNEEELREYKDELVRSIEKYKAARSAFLFPMEGSEYSALTKEKMTAPKFDFFFEQVSVIAAQIVPDKTDAVIITNFQYSEDERVALIEGRVQNVGPSSMTVLAHFVDAVSALPNVAKAESAKVGREEDPKLGFISPFDIRITFE